MATYTLNNAKLKTKEWIIKTIGGKVCYLTKLGNSMWLCINTTDNTLGLSNGSALTGSAWTLTAGAADIGALKVLIDALIAANIAANDTRLYADYVITT
jgi:hypothetical protein